MTQRVDWIAVDWETLQLWLMGGDGAVIEERRADPGFSAVDDHQAALLDVIGDRLTPRVATQVIACGMAAAPLMAVPCRPGDVAGAARPAVADPRLAMIALPGLSQSAPADLMLGDATRIAGYLSADPDFDGILCLPGPVTRWAHVSAGEVVSFRSFMTADLIALLAARPPLRQAVASGGLDPQTFGATVSHAMARPSAVAGDLFGIAAAGLLGQSDPVAGRSRLWGLLIGIELAAARPYWLGQDVVIVGTDELADAYATALEQQGLVVRRADPNRATLGGLIAAHAALNDPAR